MYNITKYTTHFNGSRPYIVKICKIKDNRWNEIKTTIESLNLSYDITRLLCTFICYDKVKIYANPNWFPTKSQTKAFPFLVIECPYEGFVGKSYENNMTYNTYGPRYDGNSILIRPTKALEYILVADKIEKFKTDEPITHFISNIGNNDVPYVYAISKTKIYLFTENVIINITNISLTLLESFKDGSDEPFKYYYDEKSNTTFPKSYNNKNKYFDIDTEILHKH